MSYGDYIFSQLYTNTSQIYWHGSSRQGLTDLDLIPNNHKGETVPLYWVTKSFKYAQDIALAKEGGTPAVYGVRIPVILNIFNPLSDKDWFTLIKKYTSYKLWRNMLAKDDWLRLRYLSNGELWRGPLLEVISLFDYDGVFNREQNEGYPSIGLFEKASVYLGIVWEYDWDNGHLCWIDHAEMDVKPMLEDDVPEVNPKTGKPFNWVRTPSDIQRRQFEIGQEQDERDAYKSDLERQGLVEGLWD